MQPCPECGHPNRPIARFCERCGRPLREGRWSALHSGHLMRGGAYRILEPMGKGGMGALYLAADTAAFDRKCVVKELIDYYNPTDPEEARQAQARFETEARLLAELSHPGIPRIYSYFSEAGRHYIVMEYIEGETLEQAVTHVNASGHTVPARPLPAEEAVRHAIRVCRVLEYLADRPTPVVHHDIKPANLIVDQTSGEVRLVDFGTARTRPGPHKTLFGTQGYAAAEHYEGRSDTRSDVYSLAATLYHLLTDDDPGEHPFQFPKLATLPGPLAQVLDRALRVDVRSRSTAEEFRHGLEAWLIPENAARPFVFRSGAVAHTTEELAKLADKYWPEARDHLAAGDFQRWFRERNRHDLVARADLAKLEARDDPDAALEAFLQRLNPRLAPPRLIVEPPTLDFGHVIRARLVPRRLAVRNEGRGYGQAVLTASVPWLRFEPAKIGCLTGEERTVTVYLDAARLPFRREHQTVLVCTPRRGPVVSVPVAAELSLPWEVLRRIAAGLVRLLRLIGRGIRRGWALWARTLRSLVQSRFGPLILLVETLLLDGVLVALWWLWFGLAPELRALVMAFVQALPLALLVVYVLPALAFMGGATAVEMVRAVWPRRRQAED